MTDIPSSGEDVPSTAYSSPSVTPAVSRGRGLRASLLIGGAVVAAVAIAYVLALVFVGGQTPRGTTVAGVEIGGLTHDEAVARLDDELSPQADEVVVSAEGKEHEFTAARMGLKFDSVATVDSIEPRSYNPLTLFQQLWSTSVAPVVSAHRSPA